MPQINALNQNSASKLKKRAFKPRDMSTHNFGSPELSLQLDGKDLSKISLEKDKMMDSQTARHARNRTIDIPSSNETPG